MKAAKIAEIEAKQEVDIRAEEAQEQVGKREAEKAKNVGVAQQLTYQQIKEQEKITAEKDMHVRQVEQVRQAEITKETQVVAAEQEKRTTVLVAEGQLEKAKREALATEIQGLAAAEAKKALELAPVQAQIVLAKEIGENKGYQDYLVSLESIRAHIEVGKEQAKALQLANVNVISNTGSPVDGTNDVMSLFSSETGTRVGAFVEGMAQLPVGKAITDAVLGKQSGSSNGAA